MGLGQYGQPVDEWFSQFGGDGNTGVNGGGLPPGALPTFNHDPNATITPAHDRQLMTPGAPPPGDPQLPGYGDMTTSNPWRDSLTYQQIRDYGGGQSLNSAMAVQQQVQQTAAGTPQAPQAGGQVSMQAFNQAWLSSPYPGTVDGLKQFMAAHPEYAQAGITLGGSKGDKVYGPGGAYWGDAVIAAGLGGQGKSGLSGDTGGGGQAGGNNTLAGMGYGFGASMSPWTKQFSAPTAQQAIDSPGVKFGLEEANRMMQIGPAAKGTLFNGRVQQAIGASNVGNALQAYGDIYGRAMGEYGLERQNFYDSQDRPFDKSYRLAELGRPR